MKKIRYFYHDQQSNQIIYVSMYTLRCIGKDIARSDVAKTGGVTTKIRMRQTQIAFVQQNGLNLPTNSYSHACASKDAPTSESQVLCFELDTPAGLYTQRWSAHAGCVAGKAWSTRLPCWFLEQKYHSTRLAFTAVPSRLSLPSINIHH